MKFTKMQGLGNDFIMVDGFDPQAGLPAASQELSALAARLCDRHFGIGADGLILALPSKAADARMRIFNRDGTEPEMCGNGIRCLGKFLYDRGLCRRPAFTVETLAGTLALQIEAVDGLARQITVDMGRPCFEPARIPVDSDSNRLNLKLAGRELRFFCVSMGNPHAVTFDLYPGDDEFMLLGPLAERHAAFPRRANIEFCRLSPEGGVDVRVWERGDGPTLACGTGACAVVATGASLGLLPRQARVRLPGGAMDIRWAEDDRLFMTGPAETVFTGEV